MLVHYLNIAQRQQAGRASKRITNEETASQPKSDDKDSSSHSDPETSPASDTEYATTQGMPSPAEQHQHAGHAAAAGIHAAAPPSGLLAAAEPYMPLLPSMSMDGFFAQIDGKLSSDKLGLDEPLRSNVAVQELLHTWEAEQHNVDPSALFSTSAHWQVRHAFASTGSWHSCTALRQSLNHTCVTNQLQASCSLHCAYHNLVCQSIVKCAP